MSELLERMTLQDMEVYAPDGSLPTWFTDTVNTTATSNKPKTGYPAGSVYRRLAATALDSEDE